MSAPGQAAQAKLDAKVRETVLFMLDKIDADEIKLPRAVSAELTEVRIAFNAANALAAVLAEEEPGK